MPMADAEQPVGHRALSPLVACDLMCPALRFPLPADLLRRLPRHPDWKYERIDGEAWLSPRPRPLWLVRSTEAPVPAARPASVDVRLVDERRDRAAIVELLVEVWVDEDPYCCMDDPEGQLRAEIERSFDVCGLGVLGVDAQGVCAAVVVSPSDADAPTLAWLTVRRDVRDRGLATALLSVVTEALSADGIRTLTSATSAANVPSLRWHLSRGFELAADPLREAMVQSALMKAGGFRASQNG
jgi:GNAT superfamily N-acetyltransferase